MLENTYVALKLVSGETIMSILVHESEDEYTIEFPLAIDDRTQDAWAFCPYSDDPVMFIHKKHVVYVKEISSYYVERYSDILASIENTHHDDVLLRDKDTTLQ